MAYLEIANWQPLGDNQMRKWDVYDMMIWGDDVSIDKNLVAVGSYGGPIAMVRDRDKIMRLKGSGKGMDDVVMYTAAGKPLGAVASRADSRVILMGWSSTEDLWIAYENGAVDIFTILGRPKETGFSFLPGLTEDVVINCVMGDTAMAALVRTPADDFRVFVVTDMESPIPLEVDEPGLIQGIPPTAMGLIEATFTESGIAEVLLGTADSSILVVLPDGAEDQQLQDTLASPVRQMAVAPNGNYVACVLENGFLNVMGTNFETKLLEFNTKATEAPQQLVWCAEDAVVMSWRKKGLLMVGPFGDWLKYAYEEPIHLVQEHDCVRIITDTRHQILQRVPKYTEAIRQIGSTAPAAMLFDAMESFESGDAKADDSLRVLQEDETLMDAVYDCLQAAACEFDHTQQRALLRASSFGKNFDPEAETTAEGADGDVNIHMTFVDVCKKLRVLNSLRDFQVGLPLTSAQYDKLTPEVAVDRLINRHQHRLALLVCGFLNMPKDHVLVHWACAKVRAANDLSDEAVRDLVRGKLKDCTNVSYADIAATADASGRRLLATMLLDFEPRAADQVPLLLKMREPELALTKAIDSGDTDLIYLALLHMKRTMTGEDRDENEFFRAIVPHREAVHLLITYCKHRDVAMLKRLYKAYGYYLEFGQHYVTEAYKSADLPKRVEKLGYAEKVFEAAVAKGQKSLVFHEKATSDQIKLLTLQDALEDGGAGEADYVDHSVSETLFNMVVLGHNDQANRLRKEFAVPDNRFWHTKVRALAQCEDWAGLQAFSKEKKSPIGYRPFVDACVDAGNKSEAAKYAGLIPDLEERADLFIKIQAWSDAAATAAKARDGERLMAIRAACNNASLVREIDATLASL